MAAPAHAGVVVGAGVPFSAAELEEAIAARDGGAGPDVEVRADGPDRLEITAGAARWHVELGAARGAIAARLIALHVVTAPGLVAGEAAAAPAPSWLPGLRVAIGGRVSGGAATADVATRGAGAELATRGRTWIGAGVEWERGSASSPVLPPTVVSSWQVRGLAGIARGPFELGAGPLARRLDVDAPLGRRRWTLGAGALARVRWTLAPRWTMSAAVGLDLHRHRIEVRRGDMLVAGTPRAAFAASLALARDLGR